MARYTSAYSSFISRLDEVEVLRTFAFLKERSDPVGLRGEIRALCRGSIVLLSSHLEAYIKELGELALERLHIKAVPREILSSQFFYHLSKDTIVEIKDTTEPNKCADKIFYFLRNDNLLWDHVGPFPTALPTDRFNMGFSTPSFDKIKAYFNRFGYLNYSRDLASNTRSKFQTTITMVDHLVDIRNKIAHGDKNVTETPKDIKEMIHIIRYYCLVTDDVFSKWFKSQFCSIR